MAKEEKPKEVVSEKPKEVKKEQYALEDRILYEGYYSTIDGRVFMIGHDKDFEGKRMTQHASVMEQVNNPARGGGKIWKGTGVYHLEDLTDKQLWDLAHSKVIRLTKEQEKAFYEKFYKKN